MSLKSSKGGSGRVRTTMKIFLPIAAAIIITSKSEVLFGSLLSAVALSIGVPLWIKALVTSPKFAIVLTTHLVTKGRYTDRVSHTVGFRPDEFDLDTPGYDGRALDLMASKGRISKEALTVAQTYFHHVIPKVLEAPDRRLIMTAGHLAAIHPEFASFVESEGGSSVCNLFASTASYSIRWHSDSQLLALDNKFLIVYGTKHMSVMPFENAIAWKDQAPRLWLELLGEPQRGVGSGMSSMTFTEGDTFTMKAVDLHHVGTEVNQDSLSLMIACHSRTLNPHPYAWIPALSVWHYGGIEAREAIKLMLFNPNGFASGGNGDGEKIRITSGAEKSTTTTVDQSALSQTVASATEVLFREMDQVENTWNDPPQMGHGFDCVYFFILKALNELEKSSFDEAAFTQTVLEAQREDGSWRQTPIGDPLVGGDHDTTILVYWFLSSVCGDDETHQCKSSLERARQFILQQGGLERAQTMTKFKLAIFGKYDWLKTKPLPITPLLNRTIAHDLIKRRTLDKTAQWVPQHVLAMAYLRLRQLVIPFGGGSDLTELFTVPPSRNNSSDADRNHSYSIDYLEGLVEQILSYQQPMGSFGGYTVATELSLIVIRDYQMLTAEKKKNPSLSPLQLDEAMKKGIDYLDRVHIKEAKNSLFQGPVMDGRWWDTLLASWALVEAGMEPADRLQSTLNVIQSEALQPNGGVCYGRDFEYAPDTDDTSIYVLLQHKLGSRGVVTQQAANNSLAWLESMQNRDGGFPAFDSNKTPSWMIQKAFEFTNVADSAEIFDVSCADLTGHVLEALGTASKLYTKDHPVVVRAIEYLKSSQRPFGAWQGRWGVNYIYGVGAVIPALRSVGVDLREPWIVKSIEWLVSHQNSDGGYGESLKSYDSEIWAGVGVSTVSQTAWALLALLEVPSEISGVKESIERAVLFLVDSFNRNGGRFKDASVVGTGHRGIVNLQYPLYAKTFPLIALSRYQNLKQQG